MVIYLVKVILYKYNIENIEFTRYKEFSGEK